MTTRRRFLAYLTTGLLASAPSHKLLAKDDKKSTRKSSTNQQRMTPQEWQRHIKSQVDPATTPRKPLTLREKQQEMKQKQDLKNRHRSERSRKKTKVKLKKW